MKNLSKILVIDDEKSIRDSCCQFLAKRCGQVESAENASLGMEKVKTFSPDLVLVDLKMPGMSGLEFLEKVKVIDPQIVSVVITGYATLDSAIDAMKCGAYDFLPKPFGPDELWIIVQRGLEKRRLILATTRMQEEKERMNNFFITMVSHQMKSPIATAQQNIEVILGNYVGEVPERQKKLLLTMRHTLEGLLQLIRDLLVMLKVNHGDIQKTSEVLALDTVIAEAIQDHQGLADQKKVTLKLSPSGPTMVKGDRQSLKQLFSNLVNNAIKFNRPGGAVHINIKEIGNSIETSVADTGIGIAPDDLSMVFDEFYRVRNEQTKSIGGTGLGLAIAKKIVELHSGLIKAASQIGQGSTFTVILPRLNT